MLRRAAFTLLPVLTSGLIGPHSAARAAPPVEACHDAPSGGANAVRSLPEQVDRLCGDAVARGEFPGMAVVVLRGDDKSYARGYGFADIEAKRPFTPQTPVCAGSVSKVFTSVAALSLADAGMLDLHRDVDDYLHLFAGRRGYRPVNTLQLLMHTSGWMDSHVGEFATDPSSLKDTRAFVLEHYHAQASAPGAATDYSGYGYAVAGLVVESAAGIPFAEEMRRAILDPLEMRSSTFAPAAERHDAGKSWAAGYVNYAPATPTRLPPAFAQNAPSAGLLTTAEDLSHLLRALLDGGRFEGRRILSEQSVRRLLQPAPSLHPGLPGWTLGLQTYSSPTGKRSGWTTMTGVQVGFTSMIAVQPERRVAFAIVANGYSIPSMDLVGHAMFDVLVPEDAGVSRADAVAPGYVPTPAELRPLCGKWGPARRLTGTFERSRSFLGEFTLHCTPEGKLVADGGAEPGEWLPVRPLVFRAAKSGAPLAFRAEPDGSFTLLRASGEFRKLPWYQTQQGQVTLTVAFLSAFGLLIYAWGRELAGVAIRRTAASPRQTGLALAALVATLLAAAVPVAFAACIKYVPSHAYLFGVPWQVEAVVVAARGSAVLALVLAALAVHAWRDRRVAPRWRIRYALCAGVHIAFVPLVNNWGLLPALF